MTVRLPEDGLALLDIEGTTSSISFVFDVMFPFVRRELDAFLVRSWGDADLADACTKIAADAGEPSFEAWCGEAATGAGAVRTKLTAHVLALMDDDVKATGLKALQGLVWRAGFEGGELRAHVYEDVPPALEAWTDAGREVRIYSSGSIGAQKLFFGHTERGDLLPRIAGHYDTTVGGKRDEASYRRILEDARRAPDEVLFLSDVVAELDAARAAGVATALVNRPGNAEPGAHDHPTITSLGQVVISS